ncbi:protein of unknown function [Hyphomicrobium sp. MC1]|nr:protein of unknown function [Hyphomicrobium sp. MC1]
MPVHCLLSRDGVKQWYWRRRRDSNPRYAFKAYDDLANRCLQPLGHVSPNQWAMAPYRGHATAMQDALDEAAKGYGLVWLLPQSRPSLLEAMLLHRNGYWL